MSNNLGATKDTEQDERTAAPRAAAAEGRHPRGLAARARRRDRQASGAGTDSRQRRIHLYNGWRVNLPPLELRGINGLPYSIHTTAYYWAGRVGSG